MKKIILSFTIIGSLSLNSCQKEEVDSVQESVTISQLETVDFNGENIILQNGLSKLDIRNYLANQSSDIDVDAKNFRISASKIDWSRISMEQLLEFISESFKKYPDLKKDSFDNIDMAKISKDIPSIKNKEEAKSKKSVISDYYNMLVIKDVEKLIEKHLKKARMLVDYGTATEFEKQKANDDPLAGLCFGKIAKGEAETLTNDVFDEYLPDNKKCNAFKHAVWNAVGIQELVQRTTNKWTSLNRIKKLACAHEYVLPTGETTWVLGNDLPNAMDLHNNLVGRTYMYRTINTFLGIAGNIPSDSKIRDTMKDFTFSKKMNNSEILALSSSYSWASLGNWQSAMDYHTPTEKNFVYITD
jgi:hypothetical protein